MNKNLLFFSLILKLKGKLNLTTQCFVFKDFINGHWLLPIFFILSNPAKVPFRTTGSDLHIYGKQRLARRNWQPHHCKHYMTDQTSTMLSSGNL